MMIVPEKQKTKKIVSISLGTSQRNKSSKVQLLGHLFDIERIGTDGSIEKFKKLCKELDGNIDVVGIGGADLYVVQGETKYTFQQVKDMVSHLKTTPYVDGSGLKHTLERYAIEYLYTQKIIPFDKLKTLVVSAADRYGMAQKIDEIGGKVIYGDFIFGLGLPIPIHSYDMVKKIGKVLLPIITKLPIQWFYPTGHKQDQRQPRFPKFFNQADIIAGDWHYIKRYAPDQLPGKIIITQTVRSADIEWLRKAGVSKLITTTPIIEGETFATNVMEATIVALLEKNPKDISEKEYHKIINTLNWTPQVINLQED